jgi:hypothetical protein
MPRVYEFDDFIKHLYGRDGSIFTCVLGPNGSGKTEYNLLQLERIQKQGLGARYGSNMPIPEALRPDFEMDFIEDFETLENTCRMLNPDPTKRGMKKYFFFLSELGKFVPKDQAWLKSNIKFIHKLQTVRKYGLCLLSDAIDRVDGRVLSPMFFNGVFNKPYSENPRYATWKDYRSRQTMVFKEIPKCKMWFDTYYSANFYIEKQTINEDRVFLNADHQLVKEYIDAGFSIKKTGRHSQEVKRARDNVLVHYFKHYVYAKPELSKEKQELEVSSAD